MMTSKRVFYVLVGVFVLLFGLLIAAAAGGNMLLEKQSAKLTSLKAENETIELQQNALIQAKKDIEKYADIDKISRSVVPQDKDQAKTVREIVQIASDNGVPIKSVTFPASTLGNAAPAPATPAAGEGDAATPKPAPTPPASQLKPVTGIPGVFTLEIQVSSAGAVSYPSFLGFLEDLEKNRRTAHVQVVNITPKNNGTRLEFTLTLNAYVKP